MKLRTLSLSPSYPNSLLPMENNSPDFDRIIVNDDPQLMVLIKISKLKLFGTITILFLSWLFGSSPWPSCPSKSHPCEKYSVYPSVTSSTTILLLLYSNFLSIFYPGDMYFSYLDLSNDNYLSYYEYIMNSFSFLAGGYSNSFLYVSEYFCSFFI